MGKDGRFDVAVTFDERRGYVGTHHELRAPVTALSLGGLRRKVEAAMLPEEIIIMLNLDKAARLERDRRRLTGRPRPGFAGTVRGRNGHAPQRTQFMSEGYRYRPPYLARAKRPAMQFARSSCP